MRAVNLLPRDEAPRSFEARRGVGFGAAGGAALVTALLAAALLSAGGARSERQAELAGVSAELAALPQLEPQSAQPTGDDVLAAEKAARIGALSTALGDRVAWDRVLRQVSQVLPKEVWLTSLASVAAVTPGSADGIVLNGSTYSQDGVALTLARLSVAPALTNVRLQSSSALTMGSRKIVAFSILADLRTAGSAS